MSFFSRQHRNGWRLFEGDSQNLLKLLAPNSLDSLVTDPPCGIGFMGLKFDQDRGGREQWIAWLSGILRECYHVLKPGAHVLVWAIDRTSHWTMTAIEDAGFTPRQKVYHTFFTGFPKNQNVYKELEKRGAPPELLKNYQGYGSALKPSIEEWILARKPLTGPIANNVLQWGTGALNIDGCRIETADNLNGGAYAKHETKRNDEWRMQRGKAGEYKQPLGRFPANLVFSHSEDCQFVEEAKQMLFGSKVPEQVWQCVEGCPVKELNEQAGVRPSGGAPKRRHSLKFKNTYSEFKGQEIVTGIAGSKGEASRFFYCAKPSKKERNAGCEHLPTKSAGECTRRKENSAGLDSPRAGAGRTSGSANFHPTLKSIGLMRYLVRLITPPGGTVLDPFAGSGTTGCAARIEGFRFVGMEKEQDYSTIARARIAHWNKEVQLPK